jgi:hypothetical protein
LREPVGGRRLAAVLRDESRPERFRIGFAFTEATEPLPLSTPLGSGRELGWYEQMASGTDISYVTRLWISPFPPEGSLVVSCAWKEWGIDLTSTALPVPGPQEVESRVVRLWG